MAADGSLFFDATIAARVPTLFYVLAACFSVLAFAGTWLVRNKPDNRVSGVTVSTELGFSNMLTFAEGMRHP